VLLRRASLLPAQFPDRCDLRRHNGELGRRFGEVDFVLRFGARFFGLLQRFAGFGFVEIVAMDRGVDQRITR